MSRRTQRRKLATGGKGRGKSGGKAGKWLLRILAILVLTVILAGFGVYSWLKSYLHSDDFRVFMSETVGGVMGADAQFELFEWQGMRARTGGFSAENGGLIREMRADGVQATVSLSGVRRGVWEVSDIRASQLDVVMDTQLSQEPEIQEVDRDVSPAAEEVAQEEAGFFASLLPDRAELTSVEVSSLNLDLKTSRGFLKTTDVAMRVDTSNVSDAYDVQLSGGTIDTSWFGSPLELQSAKGKYKNGHIFLDESRSKVYERGLLTLKGEVDDGKFAFFGTLTDVRSEELVPDDWQKRITGDLSARFKVKSTKGPTISRGEVELKRGVLTALPLLDRIAAYSNTRRFRRLNLSEAKLKFVKEENRLDLTDVVIASEGLVRVVGDLSVVDGRLDGRFRVGIVPGTLAHIPGAETKVFIRGEKGLLWSPLRITGTVDAPKEDLSQRMIAAAGERMFELIPETGQKVLKFAHGTATDLPGAAIDAGTGILGEGGGAIKEGTDIIREGVGGVLDLIPGSSSKDDE